MSKLLTLKQAAKRLGVSPASLYNDRSHGHGPPTVRIKVKGQPGPLRVMYRLEDVEAWIKAETCPTCGGHIPKWQRAEFMRGQR